MAQTGMVKPDPQPPLSQPLPLSIFVIAKNEADRIGATLRSARPLTDDLLVIDSGSIDGTPAVAEAEGARVLTHAWEGYGPQKRFGEEQCRHRWILNIDADEVVSSALDAELRALFAGEPTLDAYTVRKAEVFPFEDAPTPFTFAPRQLRLYRRDRGSYSDSPVHDDVIMQPGARIGRLSAPLIHSSIRSLGDQLQKLNRYTDQQVDDLFARGKALSGARLVLELPLAFLKAYLIRRHFLRGRLGFLTAMNYALIRYMRVAKYWERRLAGEAMARRARRSSGTDRSEGPSLRAE